MFTGQCHILPLPPVDEVLPGGDGGGGVGPVHPAGGGGGTLTLRPALARPAVDKDREAGSLGV